MSHPDEPNLTLQEGGDREGSPCGCCNVPTRFLGGRLRDPTGVVGAYTAWYFPHHADGGCSLVLTFGDGPYPNEHAARRSAHVLGGCQGGRAHFEVADADLPPWRGSTALGTFLSRRHVVDTPGELERVQAMLYTVLRGDTRLIPYLQRAMVSTRA